MNTTDITMMSNKRTYPTVIYSESIQALVRVRKKLWFKRKILRKQFLFKAVKNKSTCKKHNKNNVKC